MPSPRISLITPSFQQAAYLDECLASVQAQDGAVVEHIVVDGGSTDGSAAIIERHAERLAWWCSERDRGQSDAIDKGLAHATGEVFGWLNSDDSLLAGALAQVGAAFAADPDLLVLGGRIRHRDDRGTRPFPALNDAADTDRLFRDPVINQPATFYRLDVVKAIGGVDPALRYVMDVELWWQVLFRHGVRHLRFIPAELAVFRLHPASKTVSAHAGFLDELAGLLHGMCLASGNVDLAEVLALGHRIPQGLRGVPVDGGHRLTVRGMAVHFLLKWHGTIHRAEQFRMMKAFQRIDRRGILLAPELAERLPAIERQLRPTGWWMFRLRRKWQHLRP
ncbi:MAG: glycosyltransferase [Bacteroidetes bacterium]|nr:glycosyltransferase [Bacteroidota bacterium]